jgi:hypothetical protein
MEVWRAEWVGRLENYVGGVRVLAALIASYFPPPMMNDKIGTALNYTLEELGGRITFVVNNPTRIQFYCVNIFVWDYRILVCDHHKTHFYSGDLPHVCISNEVTIDVQFTRAAGTNVLRSDKSLLQNIYKKFGMNNQIGWLFLRFTNSSHQMFETNFPVRDDSCVDTLDFNDTIHVGYTSCPTYNLPLRVRLDPPIKHLAPIDQFYAIRTSANASLFPSS